MRVRGLKATLKKNIFSYSEPHSPMAPTGDYKNDSPIVCCGVLKQEYLLMNRRFSKISSISVLYSPTTSHV